MSDGGLLPTPDASERPWVRHTVAARTGRIVGYLGIPLVLSDGHTLGALCVFSDRVRRWTRRDERLLTDLAASTASELELCVFATGLATSLVDTQAARARMEHAATHDALTGLANPVLRTSELESALRATGDLALLYCDLDGSKAINDRLGGDEFAVLARNSSPTLAVRLARRLHAEVTEPFLLDGRRVEVGVSLGVATTAQLGGVAVDGDALLAAADAAMFEAKSAAAAPVRLFDDELTARHERRRPAGPVGGV